MQNSSETHMLIYQSDWKFKWALSLYIHTQNVLWCHFRHVPCYATFANTTKCMSATYKEWFGSYSGPETMNWDDNHQVRRSRHARSPILCREHVAFMPFVLSGCLTTVRTKYAKHPAPHLWFKNRPWHTERGVETYYRLGIIAFILILRCYEYDILIPSYVSPLSENGVG